MDVAYILELVKGGINDDKTINYSKFQMFL